MKREMALSAIASRSRRVSELDGTVEPSSCLEPCADLLRRFTRHVCLPLVIRHGRRLSRPAMPGRAWQPVPGRCGAGAAAERPACRCGSRLRRRAGAEGAAPRRLRWQPVLRHCPAPMRACRLRASPQRAAAWTVPAAHARRSSPSAIPAHWAARRGPAGCGRGSAGCRWARS